MKRIILMRHAKSDWESGALSDIERPLNERGLKNAPMMAQRLHTYCKHHAIHFDTIYTSPALRTQETAALVAKALTPSPTITTVDSFYESSAQNLAMFIASLPEDVETAMIIGHNPSIAELAFEWAGLAQKFSTAAFVVIECDCSAWAHIVAHRPKLVHFDFPKNKH